MPEKIFIREVCPRDGFQSVKEFIPTERKIEFISDILSAGVSEMEVTSFVSPKAIPQLADAAEVLSEVKKKYPKVAFTVLIPNEKGAELALKHGADIINFVFSASESHNKANINRSVEESLASLDNILTMGNDRVAVSIATSFMCPFEGRTDPRRLKSLIDAVLNKCVKKLCLADTIGTCNPKDFAETLSVVTPLVKNYPTYLHVHDTFGMGLLNINAALNCGFSRFDSAVGGLGGCPFAPGAAGNIATEDLVFYLNSIGANTGLDPVKIVNVARKMSDYGLKIVGHLAVSNFARTT